MLVCILSITPSWSSTAPVTSTASVADCCQCPVPLTRFSPPSQDSLQHLLWETITEADDGPCRCKLDLLHLRTNSAQYIECVMRHTCEEFQARVPKISIQLEWIYNLISTVMFHVHRLLVTETHCYMFCSLVQMRGAILCPCKQPSTSCLSVLVPWHQSVKIQHWAISEKFLSKENKISLNSAGTVNVSLSLVGSTSRVKPRNTTDCLPLCLCLYCTTDKLWPHYREQILLRWKPVAMQNIWLNISIFHHALRAARVNRSLQFP